MKTVVILFFYLLCIASKTFCQNKNNIGIGFNLENISQPIKHIYASILKTTPSRICLVPSISYERKLSHASSLEIELRYRQSITSYFTFPPPENQGFPSNLSSKNYATKEIFLSFPITYKFNSKIVNLSFGPSFDYLVGKKQLNVNSYSHILGKEFYSDKLSIGLITKISKTIRLFRSVILEPAFFYNPILSYSKNYLGVSLSAKYKF